jgi:hypothetical protein
VTGKDPLFPVGFDEEVVAEDLARLSESAGEALVAFRSEVERLGGLPKSRLKSCEDDAHDGTNLEGCVKTYVPWPDGRFGAVFVAVSHPERPLGLRAIAYGVRHHPQGSHAKTVYQWADERNRE